MITDKAYREFQETLGPENVSREPAVLDGYTWQPFTDILGLPDSWCRYRPAAVVLPGSTEEVQEVVRICGRNGLQFKAMSTGWGAWNALGGENTVQIDLKRMNRILEIDEKNMYAVVEPLAVCSQLQAEAMKKGLNCHIIGAGCGSSPLASATSLCGYGWSGLTTSYSARNVLGVEWVLPDGEVLRIGSLGQDAGWFNGDGPGPSLRGAMRGFMGACGGLGVFTRCAVKLFPWPGPQEPQVDGLLIDVTAEVPDAHAMFMIAFPDLKRWADAAYHIADAEIGYIMCKNSIGALVATMMPRGLKKLTRYPVFKEMLKAMRYQFQFMICARTPREFAYQKAVLEDIVEECEGICIDLRKLPEMHGAFWWGFVRAAMPPLIFRMGGTFGTSYGALEGFDHPAYQSQEGARLKAQFTETGRLMDDLADNSWGGIYEGSTGFGHQEELYVYDPRDPEQLEAAEDYLASTLTDTALKKLGPGLGFAGGAIVAEIFGPLIGDYHEWLRRIKTAFDPDNVSDPAFFVSPDPEKLIAQEIEQRPKMALSVLAAAQMEEEGEESPTS